MENKSLRALAIFIIIGFVFIVNFAFFGVQGRITEDWTDKFTKEINYLEYKVDSLEKVVNSNLTHRRDTLIIDVRPQTIKIYQSNGNSINNNSSIASTPRCRLNYVVLRFAIILLEFLFIFYYTAVVFQLLDVWKITNRKITWKAIIPFYYFIKR